MPLDFDSNTAAVTAGMHTEIQHHKGEPQAGSAATEPPYSDAELKRTHEVCSSLYGDLGAHHRGIKIHYGPPKLRKAYVNDRTTWVADDKRNSPYMVFSSETPLETKGPGPPKLWLPKELHEPKKKGVANSGPKFAYTDGDIKKSHKKLAARPRWDSEHHIMVSQANGEVQKFVREYFDRPIRKESEGVPKVRELYTMNDRQSGWWDEASPLGEPKHTYLDNCGPWNVNGPKDQQKVSYWRKVVEKSASAPVLPKAKITDSRAALTLTERLADMPPAQATQFWRDWVDTSKNRLPPPPEIILTEKEQKRLEKQAKKDKKRGGWPPPGEEEPPKPAEPVPFVRVNTPPKEGPDEWNNRWSVSISKNNDHLTSGHRQYFTSAQFLSGAEMGHPGSYLGLPSQKWRQVAKNVTLSATGVAGRGAVGRYCMLV